MCLGDAGKTALETESSTADHSSGGIERKSTRLWAEEINYDSCKLFNKARLISLPCLPSFSAEVLATDL